MVHYKTTWRLLVSLLASIASEGEKGIARTGLVTPNVVKNAQDLCGLVRARLACPCSTLIIAVLPTSLLREFLERDWSSESARANLARPVQQARGADRGLGRFLPPQPVDVPVRKHPRLIGECQWLNVQCACLIRKCPRLIGSCAWFI